MGVVNITDYTNIETLLSNPVDYGTFGNLAEALETNPGWRVIEGGKTTIEPVNPLTPSPLAITEYGKDAVGLTGGVEGYSNVVNITEGATAGTVAAESAGIFAGWTVGTAVAGVLAGAGIGIAAFELNPDFWIGVSNKIFGTDITYDEIKDYTILGRIQNSIVGAENQVTTYLSEEVVKAILEYANEYGLFDSTEKSELPQTDPYYVNNFPNPLLYAAYHDGRPSLVTSNFYVTTNFTWTGETGHAYLVRGRVIRDGAIQADYGTRIITDQPFTTEVLHYLNGVVVDRSTETSQATNYGGLNFYTGLYSTNEDTSIPNNDVPYGVTSNINDFLKYSGYYILKGTHTKEGAQGVYDLPGTPQIYDPYKTLQENYPEWVATGDQTNTIVNPYDDPQLYPMPWLPVAMPEYDPVTQPERYPAYQPGTEPYPEGLPKNQPAAQTGKLPEQLPDPYQDPTNRLPQDSKDPKTGDENVPDQNPPTDPTPTPPIVFPTIGGEANALFTVYKPDTSALNSLAGVLWSNSFLDNLMKIFTNNPMDAIISLHMLYATPSTGGNKNIKLGYLDTGISSPYVDKQYLEIDCGTVRIPEYFGDVRDYVNSVVDIYLPFVGMRHLKTQDIVGSYVTVKAGVDVFTGTVLYTISIRKTSGINQVMYAYEGNCAVALPLTGADKSRMFSVLGAAATGAAAGGAAGAVAGAALSVMNGSQQADIQRTGNFGANAGAMGVKKPYIVVSRNVGSDANNYNLFHGYPSNKSVKLNSCSGFTRVLDVKLEGLEGATDADKAEIEALLKEGVII